MNIKTRLRRLKVKGKWFILKRLLTENELWLVEHSGGAFARNTKRLYEFMYPPATGINEESVFNSMRWSYGAKRVAFSVEPDPDSPSLAIYNSENPLLRLLKNRNQEGFASGGAVIDEPIEY